MAIYRTDMKHFIELQYFGPIDSQSVERCFYETCATIGRNNVHVSIELDKCPIGTWALEKINSSLKSIREIIDRSLLAISVDFDRGKRCASIEYLSLHSAIHGAEAIWDLFGTNEVTKEIFLSRLVVNDVNFFPQDPELFMDVAFTLVGSVSNYSIAVSYDTQGELWGVSIVDRYEQ